MFKFIHVDKCGGGSINQVLTALNEKQKIQYRHIHDAGINPTTNNIVKIHDPSAENGYREEECKLIIFVRDPIDRFVSSFRTLDKPKHSSKKEKCKELMETTDLNECIEKLIESETLLDDFMDLHIHFKDSITQYLVNPENAKSLPFTFIGTTENIQEDFSKLMEIVGYPVGTVVDMGKNQTMTIELPHIHKSTREGKKLSQKSVDFLRNYFKTDYEIMEKLSLSPEYLNKIKENNEYIY